MLALKIETKGISISSLKRKRGTSAGLGLRSLNVTAGRWLILRMRSHKRRPHDWLLILRELLLRRHLKHSWRDHRRHEDLHRCLLSWRHSAVSHLSWTWALSLRRVSSASKIPLNVRVASLKLPAVLSDGAPGAPGRNTALIVFVASRIRVRAYVEAPSDHFPLLTSADANRHSTKRHAADSQSGLNTVRSYQVRLVLIDISCAGEERIYCATQTVPLQPGLALKDCARPAPHGVAKVGIKSAERR